MCAAPLVSDFEICLENQRVIIVGGLPANISSDNLEDIFSAFGTIISSDISRTRADSKTGYVVFKTKEEAEYAAAKADGKYIGRN